MKKRIITILIEGKKRIRIFATSYAAGTNTNAHTIDWFYTRFIIIIILLGLIYINADRETSVGDGGRLLKQSFLFLSGCGYRPQRPFTVNSTSVAVMVNHFVSFTQCGESAID